MENKWKLGQIELRDGFIWFQNSIYSNSKASIPQKLSATQLRLFIYNKMLGEAALPIHFGRNRFSSLLLQNIILFYIRCGCDFWRDCAQNADESKAISYPALIYSTFKLHVYQLIKHTYIQVQVEVEDYVKLFCRLKSLVR